MRKVCQFAGVIVWIIGLKFFVDTYTLMKEFGNEGGVFDSGNVQVWIPVFGIFLYGLILWVLGMIYDTVIKIQEYQAKAETNQNNLCAKLFSKLEQLEKNMAGTPIGSTMQHAFSKENVTNTSSWFCPECGHENDSTKQTCAICGFPRKN